MLNALKGITSGTPVSQTQLTEAQTTFDWAKWTSVNVKYPIIAGHSFGGTLGVGVQQCVQHMYFAVTNPDLGYCLDGRGC